MLEMDELDQNRIRRQRRERTPGPTDQGGQLAKLSGQLANLQVQMVRLEDKLDRILNLLEQKEQ